MGYLFQLLTDIAFGEKRILGLYKLIDKKYEPHPKPSQVPGSVFLSFSAHLTWCCHKFVIHSHHPKRKRCSFFIWSLIRLIHEAVISLLNLARGRTGTDVLWNRPHVILHNYPGSLNLTFYIYTRMPNSRNGRNHDGFPYSCR